MYINWIVKWWDGSKVRSTHVSSDAWNLMQAASNAGVYITYLISIEQAPEA